MSFEADFQDLIETATGLPAFWLRTPDGYTVVDGVVILQQIGGKENWYLEKESMPSHEHARVQVLVLMRSYAGVIPKMRDAKNAIALGPYPSEPYGAPTDMSNATLGLDGKMQQFGIWYPV